MSCFFCSCSILGGSFCRLILEFALPKDGLLLLVGTYAKSFGPGAYFGVSICIFIFIYLYIYIYMYMYIYIYKYMLRTDSSS